MWEKYKLQFSIAIVVLIILIAASVYFYFQGKNNDETSKLPKKTDWGKDLTELESNEIIKHATALHRDMKGLNMWFRDAKIYTDYLATSDRVFVGTANYFLDNISKDENLAKWIKGESFLATNGKELLATVDSIIERLAKFNIV